MSRPADRILTLRRRAEVRNRWLAVRLAEILPALMAREGLDLWIVAAREYNEDPVIMTLLPEPMMAARRRTILLFFRRAGCGAEAGGAAESLTISRYGIGDLYEAAWNPAAEDEWGCLARLVRERDPRVIGINVSETFAFGDGLTHSEHGLLMAALGPEYAGRCRGAERVAVGWLERRTPAEIDAYPGIVAIGHHLVAEAYSDRVIYPGVTTTDDVVWWMRERILELGLGTWFQPSVSIQAPGMAALGPGADDGGREEPRKTILPGDLLHCDVGVVYLGLATDHQQNAYVLRPGERDAPDGLKAALVAANRLQDIVTGEFAAGRTGNQILSASLMKAAAAGLQASVYTHPLGCHGHAAGPTIGLWDRQDGVPGRGDYPLFHDTCYALELNVRQAVPEWDGQEVRMALEEDIVFTGGTVRYLDGRQTALHLIG